MAGHTMTCSLDIRSHRSHSSSRTARPPLYPKVDRLDSPILSLDVCDNGVCCADGVGNWIAGVDFELERGVDASLSFVPAGVLLVSR
jgi:hypothetical protein